MDNGPPTSISAMHGATVSAANQIKVVPVAAGAAPLMKPCKARPTKGGFTMSVQYFSAGEERRNDLRSFLERWTQGYKDMNLDMDEVDILRGGIDHDLSNAEQRQLMFQM